MRENRFKRPGKVVSVNSIAKTRAAEDYLKDLPKS